MFSSRLLLVAALVAAVLVGVGGWWWSTARAIPVPDYVSEPCATWFRDVPRRDPGSAPEGWTRTFRAVIGGEELVYGQIPGHYWRLGADPSVVCGLHYNTGGTSASAEHPDALLYIVEGRLASMPMSRQETPQPDEPWRVYETLLEDSPESWLAGRPDEPGYVYWRSYFHPRTRTAEPVGYWLRHIAVGSFTFDLGDPSGGYDFTHHVHPGVDLEFAPKVKFDAGP